MGDKFFGRDEYLGSEMYMTLKLFLSVTVLQEMTSLVVSGHSPNVIDLSICGIGQISVEIYLNGPEGIFGELRALYVTEFGISHGFIYHRNWFKPFLKNVVRTLLKFSTFQIYLHIKVH